METTFLHKKKLHFHGNTLYKIHVSMEIFIKPMATHLKSIKMQPPLEIPRHKPMIIKHLSTGRPIMRQNIRALIPRRQTLFQPQRLSLVAVINNKFPLSGRGGFGLFYLSIGDFRGAEEAAFGR